MRYCYTYNKSAQVKKNPDNTSVEENVKQHHKLLIGVQSDMANAKSW